jgi:hypothetical protein
MPGPPFQHKEAKMRQTLLPRIYKRRVPRSARSAQILEQSMAVLLNIGAKIPHFTSKCAEHSRYLPAAHWRNSIEFLTRNKMRVPSPNPTKCSSQNAIMFACRPV